MTADPSGPHQVAASRPVDGLPEGVRLGDPVDLGGSERSQVHRRAVLAGPDDWGSSVVVKRFVPQPMGSRAAMGYDRERVGLAHLPGVPRLLACDDRTQTLVMEDLGEHPTLADVLLGTDPDTAYQRTLAWAGALGRTVRSDPALLAEARRQLGEAVSQDRDVRQDYPRAGLARLRDLGVEADWIGHCTYGDPGRFFSYRRATHEGAADYGRLISAITL